MVKSDLPLKRAKESYAGFFNFGLLFPFTPIQGTMIQRIQSIFLLLSGVACFGLLALPFAATAEPVAQSVFFADGLFNILDHPAIMAIFLVAGGLSLLSIFLYKNRTNQARLAQLAIVANIIGLILAVVLFMQDAAVQTEVVVDDKLGLFLPPISLVFLFLAIRAIRKDDKVVRSMDRLR